MSYMQSKNLLAEWADMVGTLNGINLAINAVPLSEVGSETYRRLLALYAEWNGKINEARESYYAAKGEGAV